MDVHYDEIQLAIALLKILAVVLLCETVDLGAYTDDMLFQMHCLFLRHLGIDIALVCREGHLGVHHHIAVVRKMQDEVGNESLAVIILDKIAKAVSQMGLRRELLPFL